MAASSINEGGHNSSAEVSIMDVINPDDINVYRNLAGGVTIRYKFFMGLLIQ